MPDSLSKSFHEMNSVLGLCPCCGELFRLPDARPYLKGKKVETIIDKLTAELRRVERSEDRLDDLEAGLRLEAQKKGQAAAKRKLKKIDPVFSGAGIDPQDVKVIFDPVEFVVFDGLTAGEVKQVRFMGHHPTSKAQEKVQQSLVSAIDAGNLDFKTLRVNEDGQVTSTWLDPSSTQHQAWCWATRGRCRGLAARIGIQAVNVNKSPASGGAVIALARLFIWHRRTTIPHRTGRYGGLDPSNVPIVVEPARLARHVQQVGYRLESHVANRRRRPNGPTLDQQRSHLSALGSRQPAHVSMGL